MENYYEALKKALTLNGIELNDSIVSKLKIYYDFLIEYNSKVNLTAITDLNDVYLKHFADSALCCDLINYGSTVCDIGTGAGFPGVVLKIVRPDIKLVLVDSLQKRVDFLNQLLSKLGIDDVVVLHNRAEDTDFKKAYLNKFDYVVSRAVAKLDTLCEYCLPYVKVGGAMIAYKSLDVDDEIAFAHNAIKVLGGKFDKVVTRNLYADVGRKFVLINKESLTSSKYPRDMNKPRVKPL